MNVNPDDPSRLAKTPYVSAHLANLARAVERHHPKQIGPYFISEVIGEGGMGTVYKAEQRAPLQRIVAVKIIKSGMDTREVIARFEAERQALAVMDHPHVARVIDAGATDDGRPYFVMEYVEGEPITFFADQQKLTLEQRLQLFTQACDAVQHAHQKAIIHRDLKPSNILVALQDEKPWVKVIDFGVAKALDQRLTEKTVFTETGQLIGTLEYMSPEQADARLSDVDTRSDVYSLGMVLYELLTGVVPFDAARLRTAGYQEMQRIIREVAPPRPSTQLSKLGEMAAQVASHRQIALDALERQLHRELDWIPLKAMRKAPSERYATANELFEDINNYLCNKPLRAGPESTTYRLRKFLRRNQRGVVVAAAMGLLLIGGVVTTSWQAIRATRAEARTRAASENLQEVNHFLTEDLLGSASPQVTRGREMSVREAVDRAADTIGQRFPHRPLTEAAVRAALAETYDALGQTETGLIHAQAALAVQQRESGPNSEQTLLAAQQVGQLLATLNRHSEAEPMLRAASERSGRLLGADHPVTLECMRGLAMTLRMQQRFAEAEPIYRRLLESHRRLHGPQSEQTARALNSLAVLLNTQGRSDEAEPLLLQAIEIRANLLGRDHPSYLNNLSNFARVLETQGKWSEAETVHREVLQAKRRVLKDDHPSTMLSINNLAGVLARLQKFEEAEALHREALARRTRVLGEDDIETIQSLHNLGRTLALSGKYAEAEEFHRRAIEKRDKVLGPDHPETINAVTALAYVYENQKRWADAELLLRRAYKSDGLPSFSQADQASLVGRLGRCLAELSKFAEAEPILLESRRRLIDTKQTGSRTMNVVLLALANVCDHTGRVEEGERWRAEMTASRVPTQPATPSAHPSPATR